MNVPERALSSPNLDYFPLMFPFGNVGGWQ
jgi:hypothetical protein